MLDRGAPDRGPGELLQSSQGWPGGRSEGLADVESLEEVDGGGQGPPWESVAGGPRQHFLA